MRWQAFYRTAADAAGREVVVRRCFLDGFPVTDGEFDSRTVPADLRTRRLKAARPPRRDKRAWSRPLDCEALAVHPKQVAEANERNRRRGVSVRYDPATGNAIVPDAGEYRRLRRLERVHFNNAYND